MHGGPVKVSLSHQRWGWWVIFVERVRLFSLILRACESLSFSSKTGLMGYLHSTCATFSFILTACESLSHQRRDWWVIFIQRVWPFLFHLEGLWKSLVLIKDGADGLSSFNVCDLFLSSWGPEKVSHYHQRGGWWVIFVQRVRLLSFLSFFFLFSSCLWYGGTLL